MPQVGTSRPQLGWDATEENQIVVDPIKFSQIRDDFHDPQTGLIYPPHRLSDYYGAEDYGSWNDPDKPLPSSECEFVAGNYYWFEDSSLTRVNSITSDDSYTGSYSIGFTFWYGGTARTIYWVSTNSHLDLDQGRSNIISQISGATGSCPNSVWGHNRDMYQGYSGGSGSYGAWSAHGSATGQAHGVWNKAYYIPTGASIAKVHIVSFQGTTYTGTYRGSRHGWTMALVNDDDKMWIQETKISTVPSYFSYQCGLISNATFTGSITGYVQLNRTVVYEGDSTGLNWVYKGLGRLRVKNTSNWVY